MTFNEAMALESVVDCDDMEDEMQRPSQNLGEWAQSQMTMRHTNGP